jgi:hypothetical protein
MPDRALAHAKILSPWNQKVEIVLPNHAEVIASGSPAATILSRFTK